MIRCQYDKHQIGDHPDRLDRGWFGRGCAHWGELRQRYRSGDNDHRTYNYWDRNDHDNNKHHNRIPHLDRGG